MRSGGVLLVVAAALLAACGDPPPAPAGPTPPPPPTVTAEPIPDPADDSPESPTVDALRRIIIRDLLRESARGRQPASPPISLSELVDPFGASRLRQPQAVPGYPDAWLAPSEVGK